MRDLKSVPMLILAAGMILAAPVFGVLFKQSRSQKTLRVTGAATQAFVGDVAKWRITLSRQATEGGQTDGYAQLRGEDFSLK